MYQLMVNRKTSKKGFTLVEVIVVLVILAILAAIMIPAMTGWIDEANKKKVLVDARTLLLAYQTKASEYYGANNKAPKQADIEEDAVALAGVPGVTKASVTTCTIGTKGQITEFAAKIGEFTATYSGAAWTVA